MDRSHTQGNIPAGYREVLHWRITQKGNRMILLQVVAGGTFLLSLAGFTLFACLLGGGSGPDLLEGIVGALRAPYDIGMEIGRETHHLFSSAQEYIAPADKLADRLLSIAGTLLVSLGVFLFLQILVIILHEGIHGVMIRFFGGRLSFGLVPSKLMIYASSPGHAFPRNSYMWIAIMPLLFLDGVILLLLILPIGNLPAILLIIAAALNTAGAAGDLWIASIVRRYPSSAYVIDEKDGMRIFLPEEKTR